MLQIVIRSSIVMRSIVVAGVLVGVADAAVDAEAADDRRGSRPWRRRPRDSLPLTSMRRTFSGAIARHCDASTSRTCDVPMPNATAPNAPCVDVWLSPQAIVIPGCVSPSSGPMTWTMPCAPLARSNSRMPCVAAVPLERRRHVLGHHVDERPQLVERRHDVIDRRDRALRAAHAPSRARAACRTPAGSSPRGRDAGR